MFFSKWFLCLRALWYENHVFENSSSAIKIDLSSSFLLKSGEASANEKVLLWIGVQGNSLMSLLVTTLLLFSSTDIDLFLSFLISAT